MKLTITKKECYTVYRNVFLTTQVDIDPKLLAEIEAGDNEEWDSIQDWFDNTVDADELDFEFDYEEDVHSELEETDIEVDYDKEELEATV